MLKLPDALAKLAQLPRLPFRAQVLVAAVALGVLGAAGYGVLVLPKQRETAALKVQQARQRSDPGPAAPIPAISAEERRLWGDLEARLRQRFPAEKDLPDALRGVAELARAAGMELVALNLHTPAAPAPGAGGPPAATTTVALRVPAPLTPSTTTIKMTVVHRYRDLVQFLDGLPRLSVAVIVESIEATRVDNALKTEITLRTLRWPASDGG